jgi:hypothetical protein
MANYKVTLVDHTQASTTLLPLIQKQLQILFDDVFSGTSDSATVAWGTAAGTEALVLHFAENVANSYVIQQLPGKAIASKDGGFTRTQNNTTGSEFYKFVDFGDGTLKQVKASGMAVMALHEAMHNKTGWDNAKLHGPDGGGGVAASPAGHALTAKNKSIMQTAMARTNTQLK